MAWSFYIGKAEGQCYTCKYTEEKKGSHIYKYGCRCAVKADLLCFAFIVTKNKEAIFYIPNRHHLECTFSIITTKWSESQTICPVSQRTWELAHGSKSVKIPADAKATISMATGYCSIGSKSNSWRLLLASLTFPWMQGFVTAEVLSQQQHGKVGRSLSVVSVSLFFFKLLLYVADLQPNCTGRHLFLSFPECLHSLCYFERITTYCRRTVRFSAVQRVLLF